MKIPNNLPWNIMVSANTLKNNRDYVLTACNNFHETINLLKKAIEFMTLVPNNKYWDNYALCTEIYSFLDNLDE